MSTGYTTPGHETSSSRAAALAAAAIEPVAWTPPAPEAPPQPMSFNPRAGVIQPAAVQLAPQQGFAPAAQVSQPYAQDFGHPHQDQAYAQSPYPSPPSDYAVPAEYGMPQYAPAPSQSFASMGQAVPSTPQQWGLPPEPVQSSPYDTSHMKGIPAPAEDVVGKTSFLSRFKRKPKDAAHEVSGGVISPAPQPLSVVDEESTHKSASSKKPFLMGVVTGIVMMLGVGFLLGGEPDPIPAYYAPSPTADTMAPADEPLAFVDAE